MTLIVIHCNVFDSYNLGNLESSCSIISFDESVYKPFLVMTGHINVMVILQSCTDSLQVMANSSTETLPTSSDGTLDVSNIKAEEDIHMQEVEEVNVKTEKGIGSEEEECKNIKDEEGLYSEEKEDIDTKEEEYVDVREEVS